MLNCDGSKKISDSIAQHFLDFLAKVRKKAPIFKITTLDRRHISSFSPDILESLRKRFFMKNCSCAQSCRGILVDFYATAMTTPRFAWARRGVLVAFMAHLRKRIGLRFARRGVSVDFMKPSFYAFENRHCRLSRKCILFCDLGRKSTFGTSKSRIFNRERAARGLRGCILSLKLKGNAN